MNDVDYSDEKRRCLELSSRNRGKWLGGRRPRELRAGALSESEWSYIFGLFLADGYSDVDLINYRYRVRFHLQGNEWDIACRVMELLGRTGLKPHIEEDGRRDMFVVKVCSKALLGFLPDKKALMRDEASERFLREKSMYDLGNAVPFCAGLMDGDGTCKAYRCKSRARVRRPCPGMFEVCWSFTQMKLPFLLRFFEGFVDSLAPSSTGRMWRRGRVVGVRVNEAGREAFLRAGFASWSLKAAKCVQQVSELLAERARLRKTAVSSQTNVN